MNVQKYLRALGRRSESGQGHCRAGANCRSSARTFAGRQSNGSTTRNGVWQDRVRQLRLQADGTDRFRVYIDVRHAGFGYHRRQRWARPSRAKPTAPTVAIAVPGTPAPAAKAQPRSPVVQVINPFDATEVFELPAGTAESEARNATAELLLERARERRRQGFDLRRASNRHQPPPIAADNRPGVFVTRLSGAAPTYASVTR